jgi:hypothetical protein
VALIACAEVSFVRHVIIAALVVALVGCHGTPADTASTAEKFPKLYEAGKAIEAAGAVGVSYGDLGRLVQELMKEKMIAADKAVRDHDRVVPAKYDEALAFQKDLLAFWAFKEHLPSSPSGDDAVQILERRNMNDGYKPEFGRPTWPGGSPAKFQQLFNGAMRSLSEADTLCATKGRPDLSRMKKGVLLRPSFFCLS